MHYVTDMHCIASILCYCMTINVCLHQMTSLSKWCQVMSSDVTADCLHMGVVCSCWGVFEVALIIKLAIWYQLCPYQLSAMLGNMPKFLDKIPKFKWAPKGGYKLYIWSTIDIDRRYLVFNIKYWISANFHISAPLLVAGRLSFLSLILLSLLVVFSYNWKDRFL